MPVEIFSAVTLEHLFRHERVFVFPKFRGQADLFFEKYPKEWILPSGTPFWKMQRSSEAVCRGIPTGNSRRNCIFRSGFSRFLCQRKAHQLAYRARLFDTGQIWPVNRYVARVQMPRSQDAKWSLCWLRICLTLAFQFGLFAKRSGAFSETFA